MFSSLAIRRRSPSGTASQGGVFFSEKAAATLKARRAIQSNAEASRAGLSVPLRRGMIRQDKGRLHLEI